MNVVVAASAIVGVGLKRKDVKKVTCCTRKTNSLDATGALFAVGV